MSEQIKVFFILVAVAAAFQHFLFIPFFATWKKDCKKIGKDHLAVSLGERFFTWFICFPLWIFPFVYILS